MSGEMLNQNDACSGCGGCEPDRREFMKEVARVAVLLMVPLTWRTGVALANGELRYPLPAADGANVDKNNEVILARVQGKAYAFALSCPHQRTMLRWEADENRFQCPKHHSKYRPDGTFISGRATRGMDRHPIKLEGGSLVVDATQVYREDRDAALWQAAFVQIS